MIGPLVQLGLLVALTHGFRALAGLVSPRRGGLLLGLPSTTAVVLVCTGMERGLGEATEAAEGCILGLAAAVALPLAYASAVSKGWRSPAAAIGAIAAYVLVASALWWVPKPGAAGCVLIAGAGVVLASHLGRRIAPSRGVDRVERRSLSAVKRLGCRTAVPAAYVVMIRSLRAVAGAGFAGRFITFPGGSLAVLVTTHFEAGAESARHLAASMPNGGLVMLAFLSIFRFACPIVGLGWGTGLAILGSLLTLGLIGALTAEREPMPRRERRVIRRPRVHEAHATGRAVGSRSRSNRSAGRRRPRPPRSRFAPRVEVLTE